MSKVKLATVWLDGCSGCHMSFLDMDERLLDLADRIELVYSPLVDQKEFPPDVDVTLVEGAVSSEEDLHKIEHIRARTRYLVSLGDCAVTANVPAMRNPVGVQTILNRVYLEDTLTNPQVPTQVVPPLLPTARPVHSVVKVDVYIPGCPPSAEVILYAVAELLDGRIPDLSRKTHFGA
jgi:NAD-reducing hydrogenase small subunit